MRWLSVVFIVCFLFSEIRCQNCRGEEPRERECENVCDKDGNCKIRAALLLPKNPKYAASLQIVEPVLELALRDPVIQELVPSWITFEWLAYDVTDCDAAYAVISSIDAYNDCAHVFFGPACDFALASVARIARFLGNTGTPLVTTGGFSFDFVEEKQSCQDEYYMLVRASPLGFKDMAFFLIDIMRHFDWRHLLIITEPEAQLHVAGKSTCYLMMKTLANYLKKEEIIFSPWDTTSDGGLNYTENLKVYLGYKYTSSHVFRLVSNRSPSIRLSEHLIAINKNHTALTKWNRFNWERVIILYDTPALDEIVGMNQGGYLLASNIHKFMFESAIDVIGREMSWQEQQNFTELLMNVVGISYAIQRDL